ncbi:MAG: HypC/HybG/HupF family hydrogenase formation chaperone [Acidobacteria bacterium]|nr:HypC/HybG/HupF family hydrogenase formation chaperone [Acidobacteriota bacterium]
MCLAIPGKVISRGVERDVLMACIDYGGTRRQICLEYTPEAQVGDYVIVHAGFAISLMDAKSAQESLDVLRSWAEHLEDGP